MHKRSVRNYDHNVRCVICDRVNSGEIAEVEDNIAATSFYLVDHYGGSGLSAYVCSDCQYANAQVQSEWSMIDDISYAEDEYEEELYDE